MEVKFFEYKCLRATPDHGVFAAYYTEDQSRPASLLLRGMFNQGDEISVAFPTTQNLSELTHG